MLSEQILTITVLPVEIKATVAHEAYQNTISCPVVHELGILVEAAENDALDQLGTRDRPVDGPEVDLVYRGRVRLLEPIRLFGLHKSACLAAVVHGGIFSENF